MDRLKQLRLENNYTYRDMASYLNISKTFYWQIEKKKRKLSYEMAFKIANIFHKKPDDIFFYEYEKDIG